LINYRNTSVVWLLITLVFIISGFNPGLIYGYAFLTVVYFTLLIVGSIKISWNFYLKSHGHGSRDFPEIALTFDDGPDEQFTPKILEILKKNNITATFFCIGQKIEKNPEILDQIIKDGHIVGNHSYSHSFYFDFFSPMRMAREIKRTDQLIKKLTGKKPVLFRAPYGVTNPFLCKSLKKTGHKSVSWSLRSFDTNRSKEKMLDHIKSKLNNGDVVLFHDTSNVTVETLDEFLSFVKQEGKEIVALNKLLKISAYEA